MCYDNIMYTLVENYFEHGKHRKKFISLIAIGITDEQDCDIFIFYVRKRRFDDFGYD